MSNLTLKHNPQSYAEAVKAMGGRDSLAIGHNTRLERNGADEIVATYHGNAIVSYTPKGVWASWAGWATSTTATRLNKLAPARFNICKREPQINGKTLTGSWSDWHKVA